jgi:very-short-patch-repair endonuclease
VKLIVEFDGRRWHHRFQQARADADRVLEAQALGWETSRLLWEHCSTDADHTARTLAAIYEQRRMLLGI